MKQMTINGTDVSQGRVVKALEAMLDGADDATLRTMGLSKWDEQFYYIRSEVISGYTYMVRKEFNCLTVWITCCGPTSFEGGDEVVQRQYHPLCILNKVSDDIRPEWNDVCMDLVNGLIRMRLLCANNYIDPSYKD